jgi:hypothetical protein
MPSSVIALATSPELPFSRATPKGSFFGSMAPLTPFARRVRAQRLVVARRAR